MKVNLSSQLENWSRRYSRYYVYIEPVTSDPLIRGYFSLVASIILIAFFLIFALSPTINTILELQKKIIEQKKVLEILTKKVADISAAHQNYSEIENLLPVLYDALPERPTAQTIISGLTKSASSSGIALAGIQFHDFPLSSDLIASAVPKNKASIGLPTVDFTLTTTGNLDGIINFLSKIENLPRQIKLTTIGIAKLPGRVSAVSITAIGYYLSDKTHD